jgi:hypothetical protein
MVDFMTLFSIPGSFMAVAISSRRRRNREEFSHGLA